MNTSYLSSVIQQFEYYKLLAEKTFMQLPDEALFWQYNEESNTIAMIVQHLRGNMLSRWTDFLTSDGEKSWRERDAEFEPGIQSRADMLSQWEEGWRLLFQTLSSLKTDDLEKMVFIRNQRHTVMEAINRQLAHYPYHVGQIVYIGKMAAKKWESLSVPRGGSRQYNEAKFSVPPHREHFASETPGDQPRDE